MCVLRTTNRRWLRRLAATLIAAAGIGTVYVTPAAAADEPLTPMVVGGRDATEYYPWIVSFQQPRPDTGEVISYCGGVLIAPDAAVTAGHCGERFKAGVTTARIGSYHWAEGGQHANVARIDLHPGYKIGGETPGNDIAVMIFDRKVTNKKIKPIKFAASPGDVGSEMRVLGYGATCNYGSEHWPCYPAGLQETDLEILPDDRCHNFDRSVELCAMGKNGSQACFGDSGSPTVEKIGQEWFLVGIVRGDGDAQQEDLQCSDGLGIFTDATKYADWAKRKAKEPVKAQPVAVKPLPGPKYTFPADPGTAMAAA